MRLKIYSLLTTSQTALLFGEPSIQSEAMKLINSPGEQTMAKATFAAGCFWGVEGTFRQVEGVTSTRVGYTGGNLDNPTYKDVCSDRTGHAEAVEVEYDPARVSYDQLLNIFWENHDPTQLNRQGPDFGSQYRSAIFFESPAQEQAARVSKANLEKSGRFSRPIVTQIVPAVTFYEAEDYHQQYLEKRGLASCHIKA
jgi:peptide-methionine (S)-S-oxide reductase